MILKAIYSLLYLAWGIASLVFWKKERDQDYLWFIWIGCVGFIIELLSYLANAIHAPLYLISLGNLAVLIFVPVSIILMAILGFRIVNRKSGNRL